MSEKVVRIRVLAVADPSLKTAFAPMEEAARRSRDRAMKIAGKPVRDQGAYRTAYQADVASFEQSEQKKRAIAERNQRYIERVKYASMLKEQRESERLEVAKERNSFRRDLGGRFARGAMSLGRGAIGAAGDLARGAGIDASPATLMQRYISAERAAIGVALAGRAAQGKVVTADDVKATQAAIGSAATATATDRTSMGQALGAFVGKASDLDLGMAVLKDLGKIANATDTDLVELATSAGVLAATMGDVPDKANQVTRAIRLMAKQGTMGTVEIKDLATMMPRLAAGANAYAGNYETNIGNLGAIAQMAMKGGRVSAAEATNTAQSIARDITKKRTAEKFDQAGIQLFVDQSGKGLRSSQALAKDGQLTENTKLRSVEDIMVDVLKYTKGDQLKLAALMPNQVSNAAVKALTDTFLKGEKTGAGGGEKAVRDIFASFRSQISGEDIEKMSKLREDSVGGKAQGIQNQLEGLFGKGFSGLLENPGGFIKGIGEAFTNPAVLGTLMAGSALGGGGGSDLATIAALTVTTLTVTNMMVDAFRTAQDKKEETAIAKRQRSLEVSIEAAKSDDPAVVKQKLEELKALKAEQDAMAKEATGDSATSAALSMFAGWPGIGTGFATAPGASTAENAGEGSRETAAKIAALETHLAAISAKTNGETRVTNLFELAEMINRVGGNGPSVDDDNRGPRPGTRS